MESGRRESVVIYCTSVEKNLFLPATKYYRPDEIHVFLNTDESDAMYPIEKRTHESAMKEMPDVAVREHVVDTHDYESVLGEILDIVSDLSSKYGNYLDIYLNISSGTHEFAAAAMFASMVTERAVAFKVDAKDYRISEEGLNDLFLEGGLIGKVAEPAKVSNLSNDDPDREMVAFLRVLSGELRKNKCPVFRNIIDGLKAAGEWSYDPQRKANSGRDTLEHKELTYLKRHYLIRAENDGLIVRPTKRSIAITDRGLACIRVFDPDGMSEMSVCDASSSRCSYSDDEFNGSLDIDELSRSIASRKNRPERNVLLKAPVPRADEEYSRIFEDDTDFLASRGASVKGTKKITFGHKGKRYSISIQHEDD